MNNDEIIARIRSLYDDADIEVSGENCNLQLLIVSDHFRSMPVLKRQRSIMALFETELKSGALHALGIKARSRAELNSSGSGLVQLEIG